MEGYDISISLFFWRPPPFFTTLTSHSLPLGFAHVPQHFYHEFKSSISHIVLGEISFVLERMRINIEELNYSIIKFKIQNLNSQAHAHTHIYNIPSHLNDSVSSSFQPHVIYICDLEYSYLIMQKNLYLVHFSLVLSIQSYLVLFSPL